MHPSYQSWLRHVFDHPVTKPQWYHDPDEPAIGADETTAVRLIDQTFRTAGRDLGRFSDGQVNDGIWYLIFPGTSDFSIDLISKSVPLDLRLSAIDSIKTLYRDCFAHRCTPTLSHLDESPCSDLNDACYMFWDIMPAPSRRDPDENTMVDACFSVLADTLTIDHLACQEAAIHGYGEFFHWYPNRANAAMVQYLQTSIPDERLRAYAEAAQVGCIQ